MSICGLPNTGKSFGRRGIKNGEKVFVISPNNKSLHLKDSKGEPVRALDFIKTDATGKKTSLEEARTITGKSTLDLIKMAITKKNSGEAVEFSGNYVKNVKLHEIEYWLKFINTYMPNIGVVIIGDFTHYISRILANEEFIKRKAGGEAFQRFWELAGDALEGVILATETLSREDILVITEYHTEYNEPADEWELFVPGGKMLKDKFKLDSYYDFTLFTTVIPNVEGEITPESYKYITKRYKHFPARFQELFKETLIPNNLQLVIEALEKELGVKFLN